MSQANRPNPTYSERNEAVYRTRTENEMERIRRSFEDYLKKTDALTLTSPDGTIYAITVANDGTLGTSAV